MKGLFEFVLIVAITTTRAIKNNLKININDSRLLDGHTSNGIVWLQNELTSVEAGVLLHAPLAYK